MDMVDAQPVARIGLLSEILFQIAGGDKDTLSRCSQRDRDCVRTVAAIMICTWLYQTTIFSVIAERLFSQPGEIRPELLPASGFLATFVMTFDSFAVMRSGWHLAGLRELLRGGLDVSGGLAARLKASFFLVIRIFLSICIAQLTAIFVSIIIFSADIDSRIRSTYLQANAHLLPVATALVDGEIQRATETVKAESDQENNLSDQVAALRQDQVDPNANDPQLQQAQQELSQLLVQKEAADNDIWSSETFASDELGGIKGAPGNSGLAGNGPKRKAALEEVIDAKSQAQEVDAELAAARARLQGLRERGNAADPIMQKQSIERLPVFEDALAAEGRQLAAAKDQLSRLTQNRDGAIRDAVENAPDYVKPDDGFLAQITSLEQIANSDNKIALVILLIDLTSFGFELAAVLAKVTSFVPTTYSAILAAETYLAAVRLVDGIMSELSTLDGNEAVEPDILSPGLSADNREQGLGGKMSPDPFAVPNAQPSKPRRGRPRKVVLN